MQMQRQSWISGSQWCNSHYTAKGKDRKTAVDINISHGWGAITRKLKMLNTQEYLQMRWEAFYNDSLANPLRLPDTK